MSKCSKSDPLGYKVRVSMMNLFLSKLSEFGFSRVSSSFSKPIVINCVPGAGKTTFIRELLSLDPIFVAFTTGVPDPVNLLNNQIRRFDGVIPSDKFVILDEYQKLTDLPINIDAIFGDPLQSCNPLILTPNFISHKSYRFGNATRNLLKQLNFEIETNKEDEVYVGDLFVDEPQGQIICFQTDIIDLLRNHKADFKSVDQIVGCTFPVITFYASTSFELINSHLHLICLTRHSKKLNILCPDAKYLPI